jgi:hypothetical protein
LPFFQQPIMFCLIAAPSGPESAGFNVRKLGHALRTVFVMDKVDEQFVR